MVPLNIVLFSNRDVFVTYDTDSSPFDVRTYFGSRILKLRFYRQLLAFLTTATFDYKY
jgi:hypothetical protein